MPTLSIPSWSFKYRTPEGNTTIFITSDLPPHVQIFVGKAGSSVAASAYALAEMTNFALKHTSIQDVIDKLSDISSDRTVFNTESNVWCRSTAEALAFALTEYGRKIGRKKL